MTQAEIENVTRQMMQEWFPASDERKVAALKALRDEVVEPAATPVSGPLLFGIGSGAKFLGVSRATLWRVCQAGRLEKVELFPGSYRVRREDLVALAAGEYRPSARKSRGGRPRKDARAHDPRFKQLKVLADDGDENAAADLFREFSFDHGAGRFVGGPRTGTDGTNGTNEEESHA